MVDGGGTVSPAKMKDREKVGIACSLTMAIMKTVSPSSLTREGFCWRRVSVPWIKKKRVSDSSEQGLVLHVSRSPATTT